MNERRLSLPAIICLLLACALPSVVHAADTEDVAAKPRNLILMIADGAGFNSWKATAMYQGTLGQPFPAGDGWLRLAVSTYALRGGISVPVGEEYAEVQSPILTYDPLRAWDTRKATGGTPGFPYHFEGYRWLRETAPDSASTMSAIVSGRKSYTGNINVDGAGGAIEETLAKLAADSGRKVGAISSVYWSHATPAAGAGAHQSSRRAMCRIALEMLTSPDLQMIGGAGNPDYDNNGRPLEAGKQRNFQPVGGKAIWSLLKHQQQPAAGTTICTEGLENAGVQLTDEQIAAISRWSLIEDLDSIKRLARGPVPSHLLIVPPVGSTPLWSGAPASAGQPYAVSVGGTLQQSRGTASNSRYTAPGDDPLLPNIPTLEEMTRVSLNALDDSPSGFFLTIEGGAVDWAMHGRQLGRMIEEMQDFQRSVETVVAWIESHGGWEQNLLIVTSDHDHMLWGPDSNSVPFDPLVDNGAGALPSYRWLSNGHSNALVPLRARGDGVEGLSTLIRGQDPYHGDYVDQTDLYTVMKRFLVPQP